MNKYLLTLTLLIGVFFQATAATVTWDGGGDGINWMDPLNWDTDGIPTMADDVDLDGQSVTLTGSTQVQRVFIDGSATFTVDAGVTLTVDGFTGNDEGVEVQGSATLINNGTIAISNINGGTGADGFYNKGTTMNNGTITIDGAGQHGLYVVAGVFTNAATGSISITNVGLSTSAGDNIYVDDANSGTLFGTLTNDGTITIMSTSGDHAIYVNDNSTFNNNSMITTSKVGPAGDDGISVEDGGVFNNNSGGVVTINSSQDHGITTLNNGIFNNNAGGEINIDAVDNDQIYLDNTTSFTNSGVINLTNSGDVGLYVTDASTFTNTVSGEVNITDATDHGIYVQGNGSAASVDNSGVITVTGGAANSDGLRTNSSGSLTNNAGAFLYFINTGADAIQIDANSTVNNSGTISVDGTSSAASGSEEAMELNGVGSVFNNMTGAIYIVVNCADDGIEVNNGSIVNNDGDMRFEAYVGEAIETFTGFTFNNTANATFAPGASPGEFELKGDLDLGTSTTTFEITGTSHTTQYDRIENFTGSTITITNAKVHLDWGTFVPAVGNKFRIIDGSGDVSGTFLPANITSSNSSIEYVVNYDSDGITEVEIEVTAILPVELTYFEGKIDNAASYLSWETQTEESNDYFEVQYSTDGREFSTIGMVDGNGTTSEVQNYEYTHKDVKSTDNYYRLKQVDFDGDFEYSDIIYLKNNVSDTPVAIYPNPARELVTYDGEAAILTFFDIQGRQVMQQPANERTTIDISTLKSGVYTIEILTNTGNRIFEKLIKK